MYRASQPPGPGIHVHGIRGTQVIPEAAVEAAAKKLGVDLKAIKDRQISVDANAYLNILPDRWDARNAYLDRRDLLRLVTEIQTSGQ